MSDYTGELPIQIVTIRILKAEPQMWYADKVGHKVKAIKHTYNDGSPPQYSQYPRPTGFEPHGHYTNFNVEEV